MIRAFTAVQPSGNLHIGNYFGAIKNFVKMQDHNDFFCIADLHALTLHQNPKQLKDSILKTAAIYIACGMDVSKTTIFQQSAIPEHGQLSWILGCNTPLGWMNRMIQFKEKSKNKADANLGLYSYPVLMTADILLYRASLVPIGEDQLQHINLANDIAARFNHTYKTDYFPEIQPLMTHNSSRIMSLRDGTKKMSKSDESDYSRINLLDDCDTIALKIKKSKSDSMEGVSYHKISRPECSNLLTIYGALTDTDPEKIAYRDKFSTFKQELTDVLIYTLEPIRNETVRLLQDPKYLYDVLEIGYTKASMVAESNLYDIKQIIGLE